MSKGVFDPNVFDRNVFDCGDEPRAGGFPRWEIEERAKKDDKDIMDIIKFFVILNE